MRVFSLKGWLAQRRARKAILALGVPLKADERLEIDYICAHYTVAGLSFVIKTRNGMIIQKKTQATPKDVADMFLSLEG